MTRRYKVAFALIALALLVLAGPPVAYRYAHPFTYNQFLVAQTNLLHGKWRPSEWVDSLRSSWSAGFDVLARRGPAIQPRLDEPAQMFDYLFAWLPARCVVYPTEGFYYFATSIGGKAIMGNVRMADLDRGVLGCAYFTVPDKRTWSHKAGAEDGVSVQRVSLTEVQVTYRGKTVTFAGPEWGT